MQEFFLGKLTWQSLPHEWFTIGGSIGMGGMVVAIAAFLTYLKRWKWLWNNWLTSVDPKKIGIMYIAVSVFMLFRGALDAGMIWLQQIMGASNMPGFLGASHGYLSGDHLQQVMTAHGNIMVFFVTMGFLFGIINIVLPLQIGARDVAYPLLNTLGFWLFFAGVVMVNLFFLLGGEYAATGWLAIAPLSELQYSPGVGVDYWIWSLQVSGLGTLLGGINFLVTIIKMRAPGMTLMRMPAFTWTSLASMLIIVSIFPILSVTLALLFFDRYFGMHFFTIDGGGNAMMYVNLIWTWGHPEVYVLILPAFGIYSEIVSTFSQKKLFGYSSLIAAAGGVTLLSLLVWLHHFFTMGAGADVNAFFGIMTMLIAIPTALQVFNWLTTMVGGRIQFKTPLYWFFGFISTFTFGGMAGILLSMPPVDFQVHNSLFLVAHFHTMAIGGAVFGIFAGFTYWFPKITGFKLNERLGKYAFWLWLIGFFIAFTPLYILGLMGATRRLDHYDVATGWQPLFIVAGVGALVLALGVLVQIIQYLVSYRQRKANLDTTGDPWNGRTLEWAVPSPPPVYNFAVIPQVTSRDAFWEMKAKKNDLKKVEYEDIHMPKNTAMGIYMSIFAFMVGFAFVWHINWLAVVGLVGSITCIIIRSLEGENEYVIPAVEVARIEAKLRKKD